MTPTYTLTRSAMIRSLLIVVTLFSFSALYGQVRVQGTVLDSKGAPLQFANVILLQQSDSSMVDGALTADNGKFTFASIALGEFFLVTTMVGYKKITTPLRLDQAQTVELKPYVLEEEPTSLNEVVVRAEKPVFEQRIDRLVVNVQNSVTTIGGSALDVLQRSPGITVNRQSNALSMNGKQGILVMFNGKIQRLPMNAIIQLLNSMPAGDLDKIELITNPSARYDAQGDAGIINIVSRKNLEYGTNGTMMLTVGYGYVPRSSGSISLNHRTKNFAIFGSYSGTYSKLWQQFYFSRTIENPNQHTETLSRRYATTPVQQARVGAEWTISKNTTLNALASAFSDGWDMHAYNTAHITQSGADSATVKLHDHEINYWKNAMGNINLNHTMKGGKVLNVDVDYLHYFDNNPHTFRNHYAFTQTQTERDENINISKKTPINMGVFKVDYEQLIGKIKFETGIKSTFSRLNNTVLVQREEQGEWIKDTTFSQDYKMRDDVLAAYTTISGKLSDKSQFQAGLRTEHTDMNIVTDAHVTVFNLNFWSLFPSAFYTYQINKDNGLQFSYGRRITRPSYQDIAPFVILMDPFTYFSGNPKLKPTITDGVQGSYTYKDFILSFKYSYDKNNIANFQTRVDSVTKKTFFYSMNLDRVQTYSLSLTLPLEVTRWWTIQNNFMGLLQQIDTKYINAQISITQMSGQFNSTSTFKLPKDYSIELAGTYWTPARFGIALSKSFGSVSVGVQKKMGDRGTFSVNISDIFWTDIYRIQTINKELNQNQYARIKFSEPRVVRVSYSVNFGKKSVRSTKQRSTASEAEQGRVK